MVLLARANPAWRDTMMLVKPETSLTWHRSLCKIVCNSPWDQWTAQQLRNTLLDHNAPRFLIRDNDNKFGVTSQAIADDEDVEIIRTPVRAPRANATCQRFLGSLRQECLDHILILSDEHLRRTVAGYIRYHNECRPHQGLAQVIPMDVGKQVCAPGGGRVEATPAFGGLHHDYRRAA